MFCIQHNNSFLLPSPPISFPFLLSSPPPSSSPPPPPPSLPTFLPRSPRIDGDASGTVLVQTVVSEKETCIVGGQGQAMLLPARELGDYEREQQEQEIQE